MSSCVRKILFKSEQICGCCCKMLRGSLFWGHAVYNTNKKPHAEKRLITMPFGVWTQVVSGNSVLDFVIGFQILPGKGHFSREAYWTCQEVDVLKVTRKVAARGDVACLSPLPGNLFHYLLYQINCMHLICCGPMISRC